MYLTTKTKQITQNRIDKCNNNNNNNNKKEVYEHNALN